MDDKDLRVRTVLMRGGTSRGLMLDAGVLPDDPAARERIVAALYGAGSAGQVDGLGGGVPHTSKVAVVCASADPECDVDYLFGQVATDRASVDFSGTCGNMASAVALYAYEEGMSAGRSDPRQIRIRDVSSDQRLGCEVLEAPPERDATGSTPSTGTQVALDLAGMAGASAGSLLPTGHVRQDLRLSTGEVVPATVLDIGNVLAFVPAESVGITGHELPQEIEGTSVMQTLADLRGATAVALGWCASPEEWADSSSRLPFIALVSPSTVADFEVRLYAVGRIHRSIAVTAVAACGAAAVIEGSVVQDVLSRPLAADNDLQVRIAHPGGVADIHVRTGLRDDGGPALPTALRYVRTARRLMEGVAFVPTAAQATSESVGR